MIDLYKTKSQKGTWFCGCEIVRNQSTYGEGRELDWDDLNDHEINFNKENFRDEYLCKVNKMVKFDKYKVIEAKEGGGDQK